jgi:hypothetical protein
MEYDLYERRAPRAESCPPTALARALRYHATLAAPRPPRVNSFGRSPTADVKWLARRRRHGVFRLALASCLTSASPLALSCATFAICLSAHPGSARIAI